MKCDVLFLDVACSKGYTWESLENDSLGGTECSTIRLAEGFASKGLSVVVINRFAAWAATSPNGVIYAPLSWMTQLKPKNVIHLRYLGNISKFPDSKQFIWFHDAAGKDHNNVSAWPKGMAKYNVQGIAVSDWHVSNLLGIAPGMAVKRVYSPVDETCYSCPRPDKVDQNQLVWMSSPHKGLPEALEVFEGLRAQVPELKLVVFNPGYYKNTTTQFKNVGFLSECNRATMRTIVSQSLCLFYPTMFEETFGLVAAEVNALGRPVACFPVAALAESCHNEFSIDLNDLGKKVLGWRESGIEVKGQERFRFENIYPEWEAILEK